MAKIILHVFWVWPSKGTACLLISSFWSPVLRISNSAMFFDLQYLAFRCALRDRYLQETLDASPISYSECQVNTNFRVVSAAMAGKVFEAGKLPVPLVTMLFVTTMMLIMSTCIEAQDTPVPHNMVTLINKMGSPFTVHCADGPNDLGFSEVVDTYSHDFRIPVDHQGDVFACTFYAEGFQPTHVELASIRVYCEVCTWTVKPSGFYNNMGICAAGWA